MESSNQVLNVLEIYSRLSANTGVNLSEQRGWSLDDGNPAHVHRGCKPGHIADYTSAQSDDGRLTGHSEVRKSLEQPRHNGKTLGTFAVGYQFEGKAFFECFADCAEDAGLRYNKKRAGQAGPLKMSLEILKATAPYDDVIRSVR